MNLPNTATQLITMVRLTNWGLRGGPQRTLINNKLAPGTSDSTPHGLVTLKSWFLWQTHPLKQWCWDCSVNWERWCRSRKPTLEPIQGTPSPNNWHYDRSTTDITKLKPWKGMTASEACEAFIIQPKLGTKKRTQRNIKTCITWMRTVIGCMVCCYCFFPAAIVAWDLCWPILALAALE